MAWRVFTASRCASCPRREYRALTLKHVSFADDHHAMLVLSVLGRDAGSARRCVDASPRSRLPGSKHERARFQYFLPARALTPNRVPRAGSERLTVRSFFDSSLTTTSTAEGWYARDPEATETIAKHESLLLSRETLLRHRVPAPTGRFFTKKSDAFRKSSRLFPFPPSRQAVHLGVRVRGGPGRLLSVCGGRAREEVPGLRRDGVPGALRQLLRGGWRPERRRLVGHHRRRRRHHRRAGGVLVRVEGDAGHSLGRRRR